MSYLSVEPFGHSVPRLVGASGSPSTCTTVAATFFALSAERMDDDAARYRAIRADAARLDGARDLELSHLRARAGDVESDPDGRACDRRTLQERPPSHRASAPRCRAARAMSGPLPCSSGRRKAASGVW